MLEVIKNKSKPFIFPYDCEIKLDTIIEGNTFVKTHKNFVVRGERSEDVVKIFIRINNAIARLSLIVLTDLIKKSLDKEEIEQLKMML